MTADPTIRIAFEKWYSDDWKTPKSVVRVAIRDGLLYPPRGNLNPPWIEWLMGWCIGWTDLQPLGMDKFQQWRQQHGGF